MRRIRGGIALLLALPAGAIAASTPTATAVEYYNAGLGHYFMTANPVDMSIVESGGAGPGWSRTGGTFGVYAAAGDAPDAVPVCRFYGTPGIGPNSHFYTANAGECAFLKTTIGWTYEGIAFYIEPVAGGACSPGTTPVFRSYNNGAARNDSNHRFTVDATVQARTVAAGSAPEGVAMCAPLSQADLDADALRLLRQATFGPTQADLARVLAAGPAAWVDEQFALPITPYTAYAYTPSNRPDSCVDDRTQPVRPDSYCARDNYTLFQLQLEFFRQAVTQADQLRGRVAFALSQIFVTSGLDNSRNYAMRHYQQIFRDGAFGNYYDLLLAVSLSPVMGDYLDMVNNNKANAATGTNPNENYAREVLQLFSIGLWKLNADGTLRLNAAGKPEPTYDLDEIEGFARIFTGWTYPTLPGANPRGNNPRNYLANMIPVVTNHESGTKLLLDGVMAPANQTMEVDLAFAHRNIFNHPNVGPFIGKQLIQKLVTSDPTPGYVSRVAAVFADNGVGLRGDLRAVVRAILIDPEARGARKIDPAYGKLSEPALFMTAMTRALGGRTDGVFFRGASSLLGQFVFYPPSVFNHYPPDQTVPGTTLLGPEFGIQTTSTAISRSNIANALIYSAQINPDASVFGATGSALDLSAYQAAASDAGALVERFNRYLLAGRMSAAMKGAIVTAVNALPATDPLGRTRAAAYLVVTSPQYQVER
ncbi:MAG: DUF1800 domain-containing protein [Betaproteobacteria bacterium]|nr:DUF1800 domain-containing protein [Betaproteobacteria bacterium]